MRLFTASVFTRLRCPPMLNLQYLDIKVLRAVGFGTQSSEQFGVFTENKFAPLAAPPTLATTPLSIAW